MSAIYATLRKIRGFQLQQVEGFLPDILNNLDAAPPDVILFDLATAQPHYAIPLLRKHPTIKLIGIDLMSNEMLLFSGAQFRLLTIKDLLQAIEGSTSNQLTGEREDFQKQRDEAIAVNDRRKDDEDRCPGEQPGQPC